MKRKVLLQLVVPLLSLCVLFLLLTMDPVRPSQAEKLLEISVLFRQSDASTWSVARQGMEQAALDLNAELRFLIPAGEDLAAEQRELLEREAESGTNAILLIPSDREALADTVEVITSAGTPVVTLETDMSDAGASVCIGADNVALVRFWATRPSTGAGGLPGGAAGHRRRLHRRHRPDGGGPGGVRGGGTTGQPLPPHGRRESGQRPGADVDGHAARGGGGL